MCLSLSLKYLKQMRKRHNCWALLISEHQNLTLIHTHLLQHTRTDLDLYICCFFHQSHSQPYCLFPLSTARAKYSILACLCHDSFYCLPDLSNHFALPSSLVSVQIPDFINIYIEKMFWGGHLRLLTKEPSMLISSWLVTDKVWVIRHGLLVHAYSFHGN